MSAPKQQVTKVPTMACCSQHPQLLRERTAQLETGEYSSQMASSSRLCAYFGKCRVWNLLLPLSELLSRTLFLQEVLPLQMMEQLWYIWYAQLHLTELHFCKFSVAWVCVQFRGGCLFVSCFVEVLLFCSTCNSCKILYSNSRYWFFF